ncbi:hypothetical protein PROFUN_02843 [Planoprotostelium fungivorum]|uniref:AMP-activated protein kinase glycogen-binding domain-containing protein n=1 Tax=Planoprotostelium fungivorum TaxID=1890364 RepID=A0A2P6NRV3_9EUKA|nr:hypothetical protein PROFUN_02843 [Planoprotostelium fungivorum]
MRLKGRELLRDVLNFYHASTSMTDENNDEELNYESTSFEDAETWLTRRLKELTLRRQSAILDEDYRLSMQLKEKINRTQIELNRISIASLEEQIRAVANMKPEVPRKPDFSLPPAETQRSQLPSEKSTTEKNNARRAQYPEDKRLFDAARSNRMNEVIALIQAEVNINSLDFQTGNSALHGAAGEASAVAIVKYLCEKGAAVDVKNRRGETPLHLSTKKRCDASSQLLLQHGADLMQRDNMGNTCLDNVKTTPSYHAALMEAWTCSTLRTKEKKEREQKEEETIEVHLRTGEQFVFSLDKRETCESVVNRMCAKLGLNDIKPHLEIVESMMGRETPVSSTQLMNGLKSSWPGENPSYFKFVFRIKRGSPTNAQMAFREMLYDKEVYIMLARKKEEGYCSIFEGDRSPMLVISKLKEAKREIASGEPLKERTHRSDQQVKEMDSTIAADLYWTHGGHNVLVCGQWDRWSPTQMIRKDDGTFVARVEGLSPGCRYLYKYIVDGSWRLDETTETDDTERFAGGNVTNNVLLSAVADFSTTLLAILMKHLLKKMKGEKEGEPWDRLEWSILTPEESSTVSLWATLRSVSKSWKKAADEYVGLNFWDNWLVGQAASRGSHHTVEWLLSSPSVDPTVGESFALIRASCTGQLKVVEALLRDGRCNPDDGGSEALTMACQEGHVQIVSALLRDKRCDPSAYENAALVAASRGGHCKIVAMLLLDQRVDPSKPNHQSMMEACKMGRENVVDLLIRDGRADPSYRINQAIRQASQNGHHQIVKILLGDQRVCPTACEHEALRMASQKGHLSVVMELLSDPRVDPSAKNNAAIIQAIRRGDQKMVDTLMSDSRLQPKRPWLLIY